MGASSLRTYTAAEEDALDARISDLEAAVRAERRRRWALHHERKGAQRAREDGQEAVHGLRAIAGALQQLGGGDSPGEGRG